MSTLTFLMVVEANCEPISAGNSQTIPRLSPKVRRSKVFKNSRCRYGQFVSKPKSFLSKIMKTLRFADWKAWACLETTIKLPPELAWV